MIENNPLTIRNEAVQVDLSTGRMPDRYVYEFQMLIREFLPFASFQDPGPQAIHILAESDHAELVRGDVHLRKEYDQEDPGLTGDPLKNHVKKAIYELLTEYNGIHVPWGILTGVRPTKIAYAALDQGKSENQIMDTLVRSFCLSREKASLMTETARHERQILSGYDGKDVSIYVGIPFCPTRCAYCSFVSYDYSRYGQLSEDYLDALIHEIEVCQPMIAGRRLQSFYMGGGTPTVLSAGQLERLILSIQKAFGENVFKEWTVEGGRPDTITKEKLNVLQQLGIRRISINPQTLNQKTLDRVGRRHTVEQIYEAYDLAREVGFDTINMDFILGLPGEGVEEVERSMEGVLRLKPENLTIHTLAIKRSSALNQEGTGSDLAQQGPLISRMLEVTQSTAQALGLSPYYMYRQKNMAGNFENVGYSLPGHECTYNIEIMEERQSILAFGAGAVSKIYYPDENRLERVPNVKNVTDYIERVDEMIERKRRELGV